MEIRLNAASDFVLYDQIRTNKQKTCSMHPVTAKERHSSLSPLKEGSKFGTPLDAYVLPAPPKPAMGHIPFFTSNIPN